jgi:hypothetical protein
MPSTNVDIDTSKEIFAGIGAALTGLLAVFAKIYSRKLDKDEKQLALEVDERIKEADREHKQDEREINSQVEYMKSLQLHIAQLQIFLEDAFKKQKDSDRRWERKWEEQQNLTNKLRFELVEMQLKNKELEYKVSYLEGKLNEKPNT